MTQEFFINNIGTESGGQAEDADWIKELKDRATAKLDLMTRYARIARCRRQQILDYFGDEQTLSGCTCDVCRGEFDQGEVTEATTLIVRQLLAGIARMNARFGLVAVAEVLAGISSERATRWQLDQLTVFGLLKSHGSKKITQMLHRLVEAGLARQRDPDGQRRPILEISPSGVKVMKGLEQPPGVLANLIALAAPPLLARARQWARRLPAAPLKTRRSIPTRKQSSTASATPAANSLANTICRPTSSATTAPSSKSPANSRRRWKHLKKSKAWARTRSGCTGRSCSTRCTLRSRASEGAFFSFPAGEGREGA
jgi:superfamily II DNA helicase RecQ